MSMQNKEILVTGYGFVGRHLVRRLLAEKARVTIIERNLEHLSSLESQAVTIMKTDLKHLEQNMEFDYIFHTAGVTHVGYAEANFIETYEDNVIATLNLLKHVKALDRFAFTSSAVVYGNAKRKHSESEEPHPISLYGLSKVAAEELVKHFCGKNNLNYTIFRFFNIYGEGQADFFIVPQIINEALASNRITLWNRNSERDFIYINDVVEGMIKLVQEKLTINETINLGTGKATSSGELADMISQLLGGITIIDKNYHDPASVATLIADVSKAEEFGFHAATSLRAGIENLVTKYVKKEV